MSTSISTIQEQIKAEIAGIRNSVAPPSGNRIITRDKKFTLPSGECRPGPLFAVILDHRNYNRYYVKDYDAKNPVPPDCFAIAKEFGNLSPHNHDAVPDPQADSCAGCPMGEWGSAKVGKGKACRNMVRLAIVAPDCAPDVEPWTLEIPPTALSGWTRLVNDLEAVGKLAIQAIVQIAFDDAVSYPKPTFAVHELHDDLEKFWAIRERAQAMLDQTPKA